MSTLVELSSQLVASQVSTSSMTTEEIIKSLQSIHASLKALETEETIPDGTSVPTAAPTMSIKKAFGKKEVTCLICGKNFITLKHHLKKTHDLEAGAYRKQFGIKSSQSLAAQNYTESRRKFAIDNNLGAGLVKARETRKANAAKKAAAVPATVKTKAPEATTKKISISVAKKTTAAPVVKKTVAKAPVKSSKKAFAPAKTAKKK
jgi:predicted transcriptional regulator